MSIVLPASEQNPSADRKRWTQNDCRKLEALELLEVGSYELIDGDIIPKRGQNVPHRLANGKVFLALTLTFGTDYVLLPGTLPVDAENSPEPDACVTRLPATDYLVRGNPTPSDLRLIVEVADVTLWRDQNTKRRLYAGAGVEEYWVLDLNGRRLWVYRNPTNGDYAAPREIGENSTVSPLAAPQATIMVADLLP